MKESMNSGHGPFKPKDPFKTSWDPYSMEVSSVRNSLGTYSPIDSGESAVSKGNLPAADKWAACLAVAALETINGQRPLSSMVRWLDPTVLRAISRRRFLVQRLADQKPKLSYTIRPQFSRAFFPNPGVAEVSVLLKLDNRLRACALRLEEYNSRWRITALEIG